MHSRLRLSLFIGLAVRGMTVLDSLVRAPDTIDGVPLPGYLWFRFIVGAVIAAVSVGACYLGFRLGKARNLSLLTGATIVALYAVILYIPWAPLSVTIDRFGNTQHSGGAWWSLAAPFVTPFVLALIVPRLPLGARREP